MNTTIRYILAVIAGIVVAFLLVAGIEAVGQIVYPAPEGIDFADTEQIRLYMENLPIGALLFVLFAWLAATLVGGLVAVFIARAHPMLFAGVVGAAILAASLVNLFLIPHPIWFSVLAVIAIPVVAILTGRLAPWRSTAAA